VLPFILLGIGQYLESYVPYSYLTLNIMAIFLILYSWFHIWKPYPIVSPKNIQFSKWYYLLLFLIFGIIFISFLYTYMREDNSPTRSFTLPTTSMSHTLHKGDMLIAKKESHFERDNIVVFHYPINPEIYFIKRIIATQDDELIQQGKDIYLHFSEGDDYIKKHFKDANIVTANQKLWVKNPYKLKHPNNIFMKSKNFEIFQMLLQRENAMQGVLIKEFTKAPIYEYGGKKINAFYIKIPKNSYFCVGDNRENSNDSRFFGAIKQEAIYGKLLRIYFNIDSFNRFNQRFE